MHKLTPTLFVFLLLLLAAGTASAQAPDAPADPQAAPAGWVTVMSEGFEGTWPGAGWTVTDVSNDGFQRYWGKDVFKPHAGTFSAWPAAAGSHRVDPATGIYPDNMNTRMVYGPFDLSNATAAEVRFWLWTEIEVGWEDFLYLGSSGDGSTFQQELTWEGSLAWAEVAVDLSDYAGDSSVWVRWDFASDDSVGMAGPFIDDITISKDLFVPPAVTIARSGGNVLLDWDPVAAAQQYEVWWAANNPYFTPGANCSTSLYCAVVADGTTYTHTGGSGSTATNYTYVLRSVGSFNGYAMKSGPSNRVGEFDFALTR